MTDPTFAQGPGEWDLLAGSGAESVRAAVYWNQVQPTGPGEQNFAASDPVFLAAAQRGVDVLPVVQGTPTGQRRLLSTRARRRATMRTSPAF